MQYMFHAVKYFCSENVSFLDALNSCGMEINVNFLKYWKKKSFKNWATAAKILIVSWC